MTFGGTAFVGAAGVQPPVESSSARANAWRPGVTMCCVFIDLGGLNGLEDGMQAHPDLSGSQASTLGSFRPFGLNQKSKIENRTLTTLGKLCIAFKIHSVPE